MSEMRVPLLDLKAQMDTIRGPLLQAVDETITGGHWILGPAVRKLEASLAAYLSVPHAVGVASGTDALLVALRALGIGPGDEVVVPTYTFFASAGAVWNSGARPVLVDVEEGTYTIDLHALENGLSPRTKAVMPVHIFGQAAQMDAILALCAPRGVAVIEDAAQSIGGTWDRIPLGGTGDIGCFSFYPSKNLGGVGDGGLITTRRDDLAARVRSLRVHGEAGKYLHESVGFNSRLDSLQAAVLQVKLEHLDRWSDARAAHAAVYSGALAGVDGISTPVDAKRGRHVWNQYVLQIRRGSRDDLQAWLSGKGIGSAIYYPRPLHLQPCFSTLGYRDGEMPVSEAAARETLSIPVYPELTEDQQAYVIDAILEWAGRR